MHEKNDKAGGSSPAPASRRAVLGGIAAAAAGGLMGGKPAFGQIYETATKTPTGPVVVKGPRPRFSPVLEPFPLKLPSGKQIGRVIAIAPAPNGDIFFLQNSESGHSIPQDKAARLPRVVHVSATGEFINAWGGPGQDYAVEGESQWPESWENLECDAEGNLWVCGWAKDDDALLKLSPEGKLLQIFGRRGRAGNDASKLLLNTPASCFHDTRTRELFIADGYGNHRIISLNSDTGKFNRMWGAYGQDPATLTPESSFANPVHKIARAPDGLIYACDRIKCRVQEFELVPGGVKYLREVYIAPGTAGMGSAFDIVFTPDNRFMLVADGMNQRVWSVDRASLKVLGWANATPEAEGEENITQQLTALHRFARLSNGDLLLARVRPNITRMRYIGVS